ncbi:MAG: hypothetical protein IKZ46_17285 [Victivallales bacterium]|nr:hypothetical protein [Victivallales bacterium]
MKSKEERVPTAACGSAVRHASRKRKQHHAGTLNARDFTTNRLGAVKPAAKSLSCSFSRLADCCLLLTSPVPCLASDRTLALPSHASTGKGKSNQDCF